MQFGTAGRKATGKTTHLFVKAECPKLFQAVQLARLWLVQVWAQLQAIHVVLMLDLLELSKSVR